MHFLFLKVILLLFTGGSIALLIVAERISCWICCLQWSWCHQWKASSCKAQNPKAYNQKKYCKMLNVLKVARLTKTYWLIFLKNKSDVWHRSHYNLGKPEYIWCDGGLLVIDDVKVTCCKYALYFLKLCHFWLGKEPLWWLIQNLLQHQHWMH